MQVATRSLKFRQINPKLGLLSQYGPSDDVSTQGALTSPKCLTFNWQEYSFSITNLIAQLVYFMKNIFFCSFLMVMIGSSSLQAIKNDPLFDSGKKRDEPKIFINNRILARINGKPISTFDLMKKMDLAFYRQYPEYTSSIQARAQYYDMSWKYVLEDIIDKELILVDAQESKIEVSSGDVRQEMEVSFGPNIIANLDKAGISFDEASKIMQEEIIIRRMVSGRVHAKALRQVTPIKVRRAYEEFIQDPENARQTQWSYRIVTVKERNLQKTEETAKAAFQLLMEGVGLDQLVSKLKERKILSQKGKVTVSGIVKHNDKEISKDYHDRLVNLDIGMYSQPFAHKSRTNNVTVYRILTILDKVPGGLPPYREIEGKLKDKLLDQAIDQETNSYLQRLRQHYHILQQDLEAYLPQNYQPFELK